MIPFAVFLRALEKSIKRNPNFGQRRAVEAAKDAALFIVAGPGTGKTATLTMRMLKLMFVDGVRPSGLLATTFTKKAAAELRSRLLSWGYDLQEHLQQEAKLPIDVWRSVEQIDINQVRTGTIDSICEELLRDFRDFGTDPPVLADDFVSRTLLLRAGLFHDGRYKNKDLDTFLCDTRGTGKFGWNLGAKTELLQKIWDRRHHDQLHWIKFRHGGRGGNERRARKLVDAALASYAKELEARLMVDFAQLEQTVLDRLSRGGLKEFSEQLDVVLVDEYQDSNLLQERLYFELAKRCSGALSVVGDDDQSLYRFRGATVDLFSQFEARYTKELRKLGKIPQRVFLRENYRSSQTIIDFVNHYARLDANYQSVRVKGKPKLTNPKLKGPQIPILGLFRDSPTELALALASFIHRVTRGSGTRIGKHLIKVDQNNRGNVGDIALLCSSPREYGGGPVPKERLPFLIKRELARLRPSIATFNPRGEDFSAIPTVRRFGGLLLMCLDPNGVAQDLVARALGQYVRNEFQSWARETTNLLKRGQAPGQLIRFVENWGQRNPGRASYRWPKSTPCIELLYALVHWMPKLHNDPEGQIYLEVFTRQLGAAEQVSNFKARVVSDLSNKDLSLRSVGHLLQYFLAPIASGAIGVDEELIESFPRDRLNILSIHQSKGLEFPMVIVDVGCDFRSNHHGHAFKRYPTQPGPPHQLEDLMRPHSPLAALARSGVDRAFDDLYRQFFVAFSRPQDVLVLVGLSGCLPKGGVKNVAMGYDRKGKNRWAAKLPMKLL